MFYLWCSLIHLFCFVWNKSWGHHFGSSPKRSDWRRRLHAGKCRCGTGDAVSDAPQLMFRSWSSRKKIWINQSTNQESQNDPKWTDSFSIFLHLLSSFKRRNQGSSASWSYCSPGASAFIAWWMLTRTWDRSDVSRQPNLLSSSEDRSSVFEAASHCGFVFGPAVI